MALFCTGGIPTPLGFPVPQVNITVVFNTNLTSKVTKLTSSGTMFDEALLMIDESNSPGHFLLNCGQDGATDSGPSGPRGSRTRRGGSERVTPLVIW